MKIPQAVSKTTFYASMIFMLFSHCLLSAKSQIKPLRAEKPNILDSLTHLLENNPKLDTNRVNLQNQLGFEYWIVDPGKSELYGLQSIELARMISYTSGEAMAQRIVGVSHWARGNYKLAFRYLFASNILYKQLDDSLGIANTLLNIGMVYQDQNNYDKAESHYRRAITIFSHLKQDGRVATTQTKWASMLISAGRVDDAYDKLIEALKIHEADKFLYGIAEVNNRLGELFVQKNDYNTALSYFLQSLEAGKKRFDHVGIADNYQRIGDIYMKKNDYAQAETYLEMGRKTAEDFKLKSILKRIYFSLKELNVKTGNLSIALAYFEKYSTVSDAIFNEEKANQIASMQAQHDFTQKEKELELANQNVELLRAQNRANWLIWIILLLLALLLGSLAWNIIRRKNARIVHGEQALIQAKSKTEALQEEIKIRENELTSYTLNFVQKNELLQEVKTALADLKSETDSVGKRKINSLSRLIDSTVRIDQDWDDFRKYFEATHKGLIQRLKQRHPELTQNDLRLLALIRINLSSKEMGSMLGIAAESVKTARYRVRKKLQLAPHENLFEYLIGLETDTVSEMS